MINPMRVWTQPIERARVLLRKSLAEDAANPAEPAEPSDMFQHGSELELAAKNNPIISKITMIERASRHYHTALINQVLTNMELLAFAISWFGMVCLVEQSFVWQRILMHT
jgi:hypothetical protein